MFTVKRIIIATSFFPPTINRRANYSYRLAKELRALGIEVKIITLWKKDACGAKATGGIEMYCVPHKKLFGEVRWIPPKHYKSILKEIEEYNPECVVTMDYYERLSLLTAKAAKAAGIPCVTVNHLNKPLSHKNKMVDKLLKKHEIRTLMLSKKHRAVFAGAGFAQTEYLKRVKAVPRFEIPYGAETEVMPLPLMKKKMGISDSAIMYLLKPKSDFSKVSVISEALNEISGYNGPETVLVVVGAPPKANGYDKKKVIFTGKLSHEDDISIKYGCDVYVHFAKDDPLHLDLLEAGLFGRAALCVVQEDDVFAIIKDGFDGLIADMSGESLKAALQKLRVHKKLRGELGENLKNKVELQYNWQQSALALIDAVWELNGARRHG
jgi:glycosyltransferase involved in cell wall biosynthesis